MVLPPGVNKATGLGTALKELRLSLHNTVGVGDAENDHAFLRVCECAVAVANALPAIKEQVDLVTSGADGAGVVELIEALLRDDLRQVAPALVRHDPLLGTTPAGDEVRLPYGSRALLLDDPGRVSGVVMHLLGQLSERGYQYCLIDPRGTYQELGESVSLGSRSRPPGEDDLLHLLQQPDQSATVDLCRLRPGDRQAFFTRALARLGELGATTGRPHLLALNAAHELLPAAGAAAPPAAALIAGSLLLVTAQPEQLAGAMLSAVDTVMPGGTWSEPALCSGVPRLASQRAIPRRTRDWCGSAAGRRRSACASPPDHPIAASGLLRHASCTLGAPWRGGRKVQCDKATPRPPVQPAPPGPTTPARAVGHAGPPCPLYPVRSMAVLPASHHSAVRHQTQRIRVTLWQRQPVTC